MRFITVGHDSPFSVTIVTCFQDSMPSIIALQYWEIGLLPCSTVSGFHHCEEGGNPVLEAGFMLLSGVEAGVPVLHTNSLSLCAVLSQIDGFSAIQSCTFVIFRSSTLL